MDLRPSDSSLLLAGGNARLNIVDHIDGDSFNNSASNLRWITQRANNLNRPYGLRYNGSVYTPCILGFEHTRFGSESEEVAKEMRDLLVEKYIRFNTRFPEKTVFPHVNISNY